jgi:hypothetical protein
VELNSYPELHMSLKVFIKRTSILMIFVLYASSGAWAQKERSLCDSEARRLLGTNARSIANGSFIHENKLLCVAALPILPRSQPTYTRVSKGVVVQRDGEKWEKLLWFENEIQNEKGYIGIDFIDDEARSGFAVTFSDHRSDGTEGFTLYFTLLNAKLQLQGVPIQISWNPKVNRFQEYAPNELEPPGFKSEVRNPPIRPAR